MLPLMLLYIFISKFSAPVSRNVALCRLCGLRFTSFWSRRCWFVVSMVFSSPHSYIRPTFHLLCMFARNFSLSSGSKDSSRFSLVEDGFFFQVFPLPHWPLRPISLVYVCEEFVSRAIPLLQNSAYTVKSLGARLVFLRRASPASVLKFEDAMKKFRCLVLQSSTPSRHNLLYHFLNIMSVLSDPLYYHYEYFTQVIKNSLISVDIFFV